MTISSLLSVFSRISFCTPLGLKYFLTHSCSGAVCINSPAKQLQYLATSACNHVAQTYFAEEHQTRVCAHCNQQGVYLGRTLMVAFLV